MQRLTIDLDRTRGTVSRHLFGHFSEHLGRCIYGGYWAGDDDSIESTRGIRNDVVEALKAIKAPNIRWPGGCFADDYHWRDGIGPRESRPPVVNTHWGGVVENNHFGTHEFFDLCDQVGAEPYICGNVGSGTVREMRDWVEYITGSNESAMGIERARNGRAAPWSLPWFGIGNENWGCGGQMRPEYYADLYRRFANYVRKSGGSDIYRIACGSYDDYYEWTEVLMREAAQWFEGLSYHYYTALPKDEGLSRSATDFGEREWFRTMHRAFGVEKTLDRHITIMNRYDPEARVGLIVDEWGTWHDVESGTNPGFLYQQNTVRDALVAAHQLNAFAARSDRIHMANLAQTVNVLQAVLLVDGPTVIKTPTYHIFDMYTAHHDAERLDFSLDRGSCDTETGPIPSLSALCTTDSAGMLHVTVANIDPRNGASLELSVRGADGSLRLASGRILAGDSMQARNTAEDPVAVVPRSFDLEPGEIAGGSATLLTIPARSVVSMTFGRGED